MEKKRVILSAGGTGGHLFPAQALAHSLHEHEVLFVAGKLKESRFFKRTEFPYEEISCATFSFSKPLQLVSRSPTVVKGIIQSFRILRRFKPDIVVGFGSFYTLPLLVAAKLCRIPIVLHEQNAVPGKVNRLFSRYARVTALTFASSAAYLHGKTEPVLFPIRPPPEIEPWSYFGLEKGRMTLLMFGGSQGAERLNHLFLEALPELQEYQVLHFTAPEGAEKVYQKLGIRYCVKPFEPHMQLALQIADLAVTRAGAATLAELTKWQVPALLVPFPFATDDHQKKNASHFHGAEVVLEKELTPSKLAQLIKSFPLEKKREALRKEEGQPKLKSLAWLIENELNAGSRFSD